MSLTADKSKISTNRLLFIKGNDNEYTSYIINISSSKNNLDLINDITKINYFNVPNDFTGKILIIKNNSKSANLTTIIDGKQKIKKDNISSKVAEISCYEIVELFDDGSVRRTGLIYCVDGGGGGGEGSNGTYHGGGGGGSKGTSTAITSLADLKAKIASTSPDSFETNFVQQQNQVLASTKFNLLPWTGIKVFITQNTGNPFTIQNVVTDSWGVTAGYTWNQNAYTQSINKNITTLNIVGTITYNTGIQGIGNFYSSTITLQIKINNSNGQIITGTRLP